MKNTDAIRIGPRRNGLARLLSLTIFLAALVTGCGHLGIGANAGSDAASPTAPDGEQVALVLEGRELTLADLDERMKEQFIAEFRRQAEDQQFEMRERAIRELVLEHVVEREAKQQTLTRDGLYEKVTSAAKPVTVEDVTGWFKENESRVGGAKLEEVASQIEAMLKRERQSKAWSDFIDPKLAALDWEMRLAPPRKTVEATKLVRGPLDAPITLIAFSDYQCPYCIRSEKALAEVLTRYPTQVRLVHRHFPLDQIHPFARPAAEAAMCAEEQGKFWPFHDEIFAREGNLDATTFGEIGVKLALDNKALEDCIGERRFQAYVEADVQAGEAIGVSGTPAVFVNGIPLKGYRDADDLSRVIDGELKRLAQAPAR